MLVITIYRILVHGGDHKDSKQQGAPTPQHVQAKALVPEERREAGGVS